MSEDFDSAFDVLLPGQVPARVAPATIPLLQLREQKFYAAFTPTFTWTSSSGPAYLEMDSSAASLGRGHIFCVLDKVGYGNRMMVIEWTSDVVSSGENVIIRVMDGSYDRTLTSDFPNGADIPTKGAGLLVSVSTTNLVTLQNRLELFKLDTSLSTQSSFTVFVTLDDAHAANAPQIRIRNMYIIDSTKVFDISTAAITIENNVDPTRYGRFQ